MSVCYAVWAVSRTLTLAHLKGASDRGLPSEVLAVVVVLSINTVALTIMALSSLIFTSFIIRSITNLSVIIWNELTPGQQLIELSIIVTGISVLVSFFKAANEWEEKINEAFEKLKKQNVEKDERLLRLSEE